MHYIWCTKKYVLFVGIRDGPDIKSAGYPARQLSRIPHIQPDIWPDIRPNRISGRPDIRPDIKFNKSLYQSSALLSEKAGYPALISGRLDIRPAG